VNVEQQIGGTFEAFAEEAAPRLRHALVARFGPEVGADAATEALLYAWHNWERVSAMANPIGYLYRVGQTRGRGTVLRPGRVCRPISTVDSPSSAPTWRWTMSTDLVTQLQAYGELLDELSPPVSETAPGGAGGNRPTRPRLPGWSPAVVAAVVIVAAVLAVMFLRGGAPDVAVEEDESLGGVEVILEYVNAVNEGDLARQRGPTDPESEELAGVFDDRRIRSMEWSSLVMSERVADCRLLEGTTVGDTYECGYERENKIGEALGGARRYGTVAVLVNGGMVSSFQPTPFPDAEPPEVSAGAQALWLTAVNYCPDDFPPEAIEEGPPQP